MKALTLTQPWATFVAIGAKQIETRGWRTDYTGPLAIHAAKGMPKWVFDMYWNTHFRAALEPLNVLRPHEMLTLPRGAVVATCRLVECVRILDTDRWHFVRGSATGVVKVPPDGPELAFGDYTPGRYAWLLADIEPLAKPAMAKGSLGLWEWEPKGVEA